MGWACTPSAAALVGLFFSQTLWKKFLVNVRWAGKDVAQSCSRMLDANSTGGKGEHCLHTHIILVTYTHSHRLGGGNVILKCTFCTLVEEHWYTWGRALHPYICSSSPHVSKRFYQPGMGEFPKCFH